jgi:hypothetical protein
MEGLGHLGVVHARSQGGERQEEAGGDDDGRVPARKARHQALSRRLARRGLRPQRPSPGSGCRKLAPVVKTSSWQVHEIIMPQELHAAQTGS